MEDNKPENTSESGENFANVTDSFTTLISRMCNAHHWIVREIDEAHAVIEFKLNETRFQTLFIFGFDENVEFSVPSFAAFDSLEQIPHLISSSLLQINAKTKIGFWCLEEIGGKLVYTYMHNIKLSQLDEKLFGDIVMTLVQRVDEFESLLVNLSSQGNPKIDLPQ